VKTTYVKVLEEYILTSTPAPTEDEIFKQLQSHLTDGLVIVVGSGLSCAEGLPGMGELGDHLHNNLEGQISPDDQALWDKIRPEMITNGLEAALLSTQPSPSLEDGILRHTIDLILSKEREVIQGVFSGARTLPLSSFLERIRIPNTGLPIITTNYDRLIEIAAEEINLGVDTMFVGNFAGSLDRNKSRMSFCEGIAKSSRQANLTYRNKINIFKPHGSLDWYDRAGKPVRYSGDLELSRLVITPGLNKFRSGYDSPFDVNRERANIAINAAARFLLIGYGFNDDHLETHLRPKIQSGIPSLILTYALSENAKTLIANNPSVIAVERHADGSSIYISGHVIQIPRRDIWSVDGFVKGVL